MGVAAAVLIVVVLAFGKLPGPIHSFTRSGHTSSVSPSATDGGNVQEARATPTKPPTASPTPTYDREPPSSAPSSSVTPGKLCREMYADYRSYVEHPAPRPSWPAELSSLFQQVSNLAHRGHLQVADYCGQYVDDMFHHGNPGSQDSQGQQGSQSQGKAPANTARPNPTPAASSTPTAQGPTSSSNPDGNSGPGQGGQGGGPGSNS
jgi:hypothetical protein